ncbi:MAG: acyl-CoA reductase, partial [Myxococcota bacterium]
MAQVDAMSPADRIDSAVRSLEHARSSLDARSDQEIVAALAKVFDLWRDPNSDCRRELEARLPGAAGFTSETVRAGLNVGFEPWTGDAFTRLVINELGAIPEGGRRTAVGHPLTSVVLAGSIPMPSLLSIVLPLLLRSPVLCKPASRDLVTASLVAESIHTVDPLLGDCVAIVPFEKEDTATARAFFASPCVVVTGSSET